uniref:Uncharacterized protein n=1 Tax=Oryza nivara TaxID=4536 RepID=A0A0E0G5X2_ORYNI
MACAATTEVVGAAPVGRGRWLARRGGDRGGADQRRRRWRGGARGGGHARRRRSTRRGGVPVPVKTATATTSATGLEVAPALEGGTRAFGLAGRGDGTRAGPIWPCVVAAETGRGGEADELLRRAAPRQWRRWVLAQERSRGGDDWRGRMVGDSGHGHGFAWLRMASRRRIDTVVEG